jgi:hypothetical protein
LIAGVFAAVTTTTPLTAYADLDYKKDKDEKKDRHDKKDKKEGGDTSITKTEQTLKQKNVGSGDSENNNCGDSTIKNLAIGICPDADVDIDLPFSGGLGGPRIQ